ncbi:MAG: nitroreductase family protein [Eubacteriales bacterium]
MDIYELQAHRRTIRKFLNKPIDYDILKKFVEYARLSASARNLQPVRYYISNIDEITNEIFKNVSWAGYLKGAHSPSFNEQPKAYILFLYDKSETENPRWDIGAASHAIQLMAENEGMGTCWMGAIKRENILKICNIDSRYTLDSLLAIGYPAENPVIDEMVDGDFKYFLDEKKTLHVPKLSLDDVLIK